MQLHRNRFVDFNAGQFQQAQLNFDSFVSPLIRAAQAMARLDQALQGIPEVDARSILRNQDAIVSARMAGINISIDELYKYNAGQNMPTRKSSGIEKSGVALAEVIQYRKILRAAQIVVADGCPLSQTLIKGIYKKLFSYNQVFYSTSVKTSRAKGAYRVTRDYPSTIASISGAESDQRLELLFTYLNRSVHPALLKAALAYLELGALQPCIFQTKPATDSRASLPPIPRESCHPFQSKAATPQLRV